jgi:hypothetical protein
MGNNLYQAKIIENDKETPFNCPDWAYSWKSPSDFEPINVLKWGDGFKRSDIVKRPESYDNHLKGNGIQPKNYRYGGVYQTWWLELGGGESEDIIQNAEYIRDELFRITIGLWNYAKNYHPKYMDKNKNSELVQINHIMGTRESRRLVGDYIITQNDYDNNIIHPDTIAFTDWGIDVHHPEGFWIKGNDCLHVYKGRRVSIPYRTLYSKNIKNLMMAGRCHSASHLGFGGTRVIRTVAMMGEAAGTAAALAIQYHTDPRGVYQNHIKELQQRLLKSGCYLLGVKNKDPEDIALNSVISASSSKLNHPPNNINNGWNRNIGNNNNSWIPKNNLIKKLLSKFFKPNWIIIDFKEEKLIKEIHITFKDKISDIVLWYNISEEWKEIDIDKSKNIMRRKILTFPQINTEKIKLTFKNTCIGVFEIRVY